MERSIVMFGNASWCITLPKEWLKKYGLGKGDKINVTEEGDSLILHAGRHLEPKECTIDLKGVDTSLIDKLIGACYKKGYEIITIHCDEEEKHKEVRRIIRNKKLELYEKDDELIKKAHKNNEVVLTLPGKVSETKLHEQIVALMKELYRMNDDFRDLWKKQQWKEVAELSSRDKIINDYADVCRRMINVNPKDADSTSFYVFCSYLEKIGDCYKEIFKRVAELKLKPTTKDLEGFKNINELFILFFNIFKNFNLKKINEMIIQEREMPFPSIDDPDFLFFYRLIRKYLVDCLSSFMVAFI